MYTRRSTSLKAAMYVEKAQMAQTRYNRVFVTQNCMAVDISRVNCGYGGKQ